MYPSLTTDEANAFSKMTVETSKPNGSNGQASDTRFIRLAGKFVNIDDLHIDLIDQVNPFQKAYEVLSKSVTPKILKIIQDTIEATRIEMTEAEMFILYPKIQAFIKANGRKPSLHTLDLQEKRLAEAVIKINELIRKKKANGE